MAHYEYIKGVTEKDAGAISCSAESYTAADRLNWFRPRLGDLGLEYTT